jgi:hypothetical protein
VQLGHAGQALGVAADVDHVGVPAASQHDQAAPGDVGDQRLVVQDQRVRLPVAAAPGRRVDAARYRGAGTSLINARRSFLRALRSTRTRLGSLPCRRPGGWPSNTPSVAFASCTGVSRPLRLDRNRRGMRHRWSATLLATKAAQLFPKCINILICVLKYETRSS